MIKKPVIVSLVSFLACVIVFAAIGCGSACTATTSPPGISSTQPATTPVTSTSVDKPQDSSSPEQSSEAAPSIRTEAIYFHMNARCVTCLCFEKQINYVIGTFFQSEMNDGRLTYQVLNVQEKQNADIVKKYGAVASQFFVNTIINDVDHIQDIQDIWNWHCRNDARGFNEKVRNVIDQSLNGKF
jgi:hypothetical protein